MSRHLSLLCSLALASWAAQATPGAPDGWYGTYATAGALTTGGPQQAAASASSGNVNVQAEASVSVVDVALHARAWSSNTPVLHGGCKPYLLECNWGTLASVTLWDRVVLEADEDHRPGEPIDWSFAMDGVQTPGRWWSGSGARAWVSFSTSSTGWKTASVLDLGANDRIAGSFVMPSDGSPLVLYMYAALEVWAEGGAVSDYANTMRFDWDLPAGVRHYSASGQFMTAPPVPEPGTWALMLAGLAATAGAARRRRGLR